MIETAADILRKAINNCRKSGSIKTEDIPDIIIEKPKRDGLAIMRPMWPCSWPPEKASRQGRLQNL